MSDYPEHRLDRQARNSRIAIAAVEAAKEPKEDPVDGFVNSQNPLTPEEWASVNRFVRET